MALIGGAGNITNTVLDHFIGGGIVATDVSALRLTNVNEGLIRAVLIPAISLSQTTQPCPTHLSTEGPYRSGCSSLVLVACTFTNLSADQQRGEQLFM